MALNIHLYESFTSGSCNTFRTLCETPKINVAMAKGSLNIRPHSLLQSFSPTVVLSANHPPTVQPEPNPSSDTA